MSLTRGTIGDLIFLEGSPGHPFLRSADDANTLLEECFAVPTRSALIYAENLPRDFFDVSSQQAGAVLQKLRNYGVRLAVVAPPDSVLTSRRFSELAAAERRDRAFGLFDTRAAALAWLADYRVSGFHCWSV
jgi:hypothetical protein